MRSKSVPHANFDTFENNGLQGLGVPLLRNKKEPSALNFLNMSVDF